MRGKGKSVDRRRVQDDRGVDEVHVDYCFMGSKGDTATKCIVVAKDYDSKNVMASVVPVKGSSNEFPARRINAFIRERRAQGHGLDLAEGFAFLIMEEVLSIRLYSGPAYQPLNDFLRQECVSF